MNILIIDNNADDLELIINYCKRNKHNYTCVLYSDLKNIEPEVFDLIILSGGIWYDDPTLLAFHYAQELELITRTQTPTLGICLGHQLINLAFGGELMELRRGHHGKRVAHLTKAGKEILHLPEKLNLYENHTLFVSTLPTTLISLAESDECIEIIKHTIRPILGVQFHPEKLNKQEYSIEVWGELLNLLGLGVKNQSYNDPNLNK